MKKILFIIVLISVFSGCGTANSRDTSRNSTILKEMVENKSFEIKSKRAYPLMTSAMQQLGNAGLFGNGSTAGNIDIAAHGNFLRMKNDSVMANLPFYGERHMGGGYTNSSGIEFKGVPNNLQITKGKKNAYEIRFDINDSNSNTENYQVYIKLTPNLTSNIMIISSHRNSIQFTGNVSPYNK